MFLRYVCMATLFVFLNSVIGCTTNVKVSLEEAANRSSDPIHSVGLLSGEVITFDSDGGRLLVKRKIIVGTTKSRRKGRRFVGGDDVKINLSDVKYVKVKKTSITKTALLATGGVAVVYLVAAYIAIGGF